MPSFSDSFCQQANQAMRKLQSSLTCQESWGNHREKYKNGWNRYRKLGHLQKDEIKTLLVKLKSVSIRMSGWALFVNSRNQRKFLASEVTHSRVKVNYKPVLKRWGYGRVEKDIKELISSLRCRKVENLAPGAARWVENSTIWATQTWIRSGSSLRYPLFVLLWRQIYLYHQPYLVQCLAHRYSISQCWMNGPLCIVKFDLLDLQKKIYMYIWLFCGEIQTVANINMSD